MNGITPEDPGYPNETQGTQPSWTSDSPRGGNLPPRYRGEPEEVLEASPDAGEDEILRSGRNEDVDQDADQEVREPITTEERTTGMEGGERPVLVSNEAYTGWLPTDNVFTGREVAISICVVEMLFIVSLVVLELARHWVQLPVLIAENELLSALLVCLLCGLYVLLRLRAQRLAWRRQLTGNGP